MSINSILNIFNSIWLALIIDPIKSIGALASIGTLIIGWKNLTKDTTRVSVIVKRASNGPLILQNPQQEFLLFEVYNQGISPVVINEVGIKIPRKVSSKNKFINLVDLPYSYLKMKDNESAIGTSECVGLPGTVPAKSKGIFMVSYSKMREASTNYQKRTISSTSPEFVGSQRLIKTFQQFQNCEIPPGKCLKVTPYVFTGCGKHCIGKIANIKLGNLGDVLTFGE
jgi:hypothetical protein